MNDSRPNPPPFLWLIYLFVALFAAMLFILALTNKEYGASAAALIAIVLSLAGVAHIEKPKDLPPRKPEPRYPCDSSDPDVIKFPRKR